MTYRQADRVVKSLQRDINRRMAAVEKLEQKLSKAYGARFIAAMNERPAQQRIREQLSATRSTL
jgi:hypothetical protein